MSLNLVLQKASQRFRDTLILFHNTWTYLFRLVNGNPAMFTWNGGKLHSNIAAFSSSEQTFWADEGEDGSIYSRSANDHNGAVKWHLLTLGLRPLNPEVEIADFFFLLTTYINAATARFVEFFDAANEQRGHADQIVLQKIGNFGLFFLKLFEKW